jgi:hypothetical protein
MPLPSPNFVLIGAERCGARWLRFNLDQHPDIYAPIIDIEFFAHPELMLEQGSRWYRQHFDDWADEPFVGETSPTYLTWRNSPWEIARRLHRALPEAQLIAIVRNPLDRLQSAVAMAVARGDLPTQDRWDQLAPDEFNTQLTRQVRTSVYAPNLSHYQERFGDQLKIMLFDDLEADPESFYREAVRHIGADDSFVPPEVDRVRFRRPAVDLAETDREALIGLYEPLRSNVDALAEMIGRDLSSWDPATSAP